MTGDDRLAHRRAEMIAAGYWRDKTILDHLDRAIERTPDKTAIVAIGSEGGQEKRLTYKAIDRLADILALRLAGLGWPRRRHLLSVAELVGIFPAASRLFEAWCRQ